MDLDRLLAPAPDVLEPLLLKQQRVERHLGVTNETTKVVLQETSGDCV